MTDLGTLGGTRSFAYGINDAGQIVGSAYKHIRSKPCFFCIKTAQWNDLGTLGGTRSFCLRHKRWGTKLSDPHITHQVNLMHFRYQKRWNGNYLDDLGGTKQPRLWNKTMQGKLSDMIMFSSQEHAFWYEGPKMTSDIGTPNGSSYAYDINNSAQIVGSAYNTSGQSHAFFVFYAEKWPIWVLSAGQDSEAWGINEAGTNCWICIFMMAQIKAMHFLYQNGAMIDLNNFYRPIIKFHITIRIRYQLKRWYRWIWNRRKRRSTCIFCFLTTTTPLLYLNR